MLFLCLRLACFLPFFCRRLFSISLRSFRLVRLLSFFSDLSRVLYLLLPQGPPLGCCVLLFGFWPVCPTLGFSSYVSPCYGPPGCFFGGFSSSACYCFYLLSCELVSIDSSLLFLASFPLNAPGGCCCYLPIRVVPFLDLLSGTVNVQGSLLLIRCVLSWGRFHASLWLISFCDLFVLFLFSSLSYWCSFCVLLALHLVLFLLLPSFSSFRVSLRIVLLLLRWVLLLLRSPLPLLL